MDYLIFQQHFVQTDTHFFTGSILGPILYNICVADMLIYVTPGNECLQYADDTTLNRACKASQQHTCINTIEKDILSISRW